MRTRVGIAVGLVAAVVAIVVIPLHTDHREAEPRCRAVTLPVSLAPDRDSNNYLAMRYCEPYWWAQPHAVDVLLDGATYTRYWDWPAPQSYSVVDRILARGRATLTYDRIGSGLSSRPPSTAATLDADVWILEQILRWLTRQHYQRFTVWTHSYSAAVGIQHAATPGATAVQRLVVTGFLHTPRDPAVAGRIHPADQDEPRWRDVDDGWLTTKPDTRGLSFHGPRADPAVVRADEQRKDLISATAFRGYVQQQTAAAAVNPSRLVTSAVVIAIGSYDAIFCHVPICSDRAAVAVLEQPYYPAAARFGVVVAPAGHSLALDPSAAYTFQQIEDALAQLTPAGPEERRP
jgi:hypothetical protein